MSIERLDVYNKAVLYHLINSIGLLLVVLLAKQELIPEGRSSLIFSILLTGIIFFSGSLYILVITDTPWLGAITPIGGVLFIAGWLLLSFS